jgi:hypothetical protein
LVLTFADRPEEECGVVIKQAGTEVLDYIPIREVIYVG